MLLIIVFSMISALRSVEKNNFNGQIINSCEIYLITFLNCQ